jgi:hypothetical protein
MLKLRYNAGACVGAAKTDIISRTWKATTLSDVTGKRALPAAKEITK